MFLWIRPLLIACVLLIAACQPPNLSRYAVSDGAPVTVELPLLFPDGRPVVLYALETPLQGQVFLVGKQAVYTPAPGATGEDRFAFRLYDGAAWRDGGTVIIELPKPVAVLADDIRLDQTVMRGTHNSYHVLPPTLAHPTHNYTQPPLYEQLNDHGVRVFELDVHRNYAINRLEVYHILGIDATTRCAALSACLAEMRQWSDQHPQHAPVVIWIEVKDSTGGRKFTNLDELDTALRSGLGDRLWTPADLQSTYPSVNAAVKTAGWPTLGTLRGKFIAVWLNAGGEMRDGYVEAMSSRAMFPNADAGELDAPWAAVAKLGTGSPAIAAAHARHILVAGNGCMAVDSTATCAATLADARAKGVHMLKTDKPAVLASLDRVTRDGVTVSPALRCNPVTAPTGCDDLALE